VLIPTFFFKLGLSRNKILNTGIILIILGIFLISCHEEQGADSILDKNIAKSIDTLAANHINGDSTALLDLKILLDSFSNHTNKATSKVLTDYLLALASNYLALEYYRESTPLFHHVINLAERNGSIETNRVAHVELAWAFFNLKTRDSISHYINSIRQYPQTELTDGLKISCFNLEASIAADEDRFLEAIDYYLKANELLEGTGHLDEGTILENLGVLYAQLKNYKRAMYYYQKAIPIIESANDTASLG
jgi:tetratricopeptide (TPR) repeat protein